MNTPHTVIYNCKHCKKGLRVEYPITVAQRVGQNYHYRSNSNGKRIPAGIWITRVGGGRPTEYDGDLEMGLCNSCGRMMSYGALKARLNPDHKCDARCTSARGHNCECSCGGVNHGVAA